MDADTQAITLSDVFENGKPHESRESLKFVAQQIVDLSIIKSATDRIRKQSSTEMVKYLTVFLYFF